MATLKGSFFVRVHGIGPWTSVLSGRRSTTELYTQLSLQTYIRGYFRVT